MSSIAYEARSLRSSLAELEEFSQTKLPKRHDKRKTAEMEVVAEQACMERTKYLP